MSERLQGAGIEACSYHAGLRDAARSHVQDKWLTGDSCKVSNRSQPLCLHSVVNTWSVARRRLLFRLPDCVRPDLYAMLPPLIDDLSILLDEICIQCYLSLLAMCLYVIRDDLYTMLIPFADDLSLCH